MSSVRPKMLIVEDSDIAEQFERLFADEFDTVVARTGIAAFGEVEVAEHFDICIIDIILPVEDESLALRDADETGVRLIKHIVTHGKAERVLVLTVRGEMENQIRDIGMGRLVFEVIQKQSASDEEMIRDAVARLLAKQLPGEKS